DEVAQVVGGRVPVEPAHVHVVEHRQRLDEGGGLGNQGHVGRTLRVKQPQQRGLAGPAAPHDRNALPCPHRKIYVEENGPAVVGSAGPLQLEHDVIGRTSASGCLSPLWGGVRGGGNADI